MGVYSNLLSSWWGLSMASSFQYNLSWSARSSWPGPTIPWLLSQLLVQALAPASQHWQGWVQSPSMEICPRNSTSDWKKWHLLGLSFIRSSWIHSSTVLSLCMTELSESVGISNNMTTASLRLSIICSTAPMLALLVVAVAGFLISSIENYKVLSLV